MSTDLAEPAARSIFHPAVLSEPHGYLAQLRETAPVSRVVDPSGRAFYLVTDYALIEEASKRDKDFSSLIGDLLFDSEADAKVLEILQADYFTPGALLVSDDPQHKRLRSLVNVVFAAGRIANIAPTIERLTDDLIDAFIERGEVDFVNEFAILLPTYVIADILGLPRDKYKLVRQWSDSVIRIVSRMGTLDQQLAAAHEVVQFRRFILDTVKARRIELQDDLISNLIEVRVEGQEPLTDDEIAPLAFEIAVAGNETTRNTLMSGIVRLLNNPEQMQAMREDPALIANAVEELLRYETPATSMWRVAAHDTQLGGVAIPGGAPVLLRFDAGNRDEAMFPDPDRFDITRRNARRHQSFGGANVHRCLGQMLARKELELGFRKLLTRLRDIRIIDEYSDTTYWPGLLHRGIGAIRLSFTPGKKVAPPTDVV
jgi:cytochrome P450